MEVRRSCDGRPPVTERERDIRLNGICGVIILEGPDCDSGSGFFLLMILILILIPSRENQEKDQDHEQELKLSTFADDENW